MSEKKGKKRSRKPRDPNEPGLFDDLEGVADHEIHERATELRASIRSLEQENKSLKEERDAQIVVAQGLRSIINETAGMSKERQTLMNKFHAIRKEGGALRERRMEIDRNVGPSREIVEERLENIHKRLVNLQNDLTYMPNFSTEVTYFKLFFELQEMHAKKLESDAAHAAYIEKMREQSSVMKEVDALREKSREKAAAAKAELPKAGEIKARSSEVRKLNKRIAKMLDSMNAQRDELRKMRREAGRLEACLRVRKKNEGRRSKRRVGPRIEDVQARVASGGSLSMDDLGALLKGGGLTENLGKAKEAKRKSKREAVKPRKRQIRPSRGRRRVTSEEDRDRRA